MKIPCHVLPKIVPALAVLTLLLIPSYSLAQAFSQDATIADVPQTQFAQTFHHDIRLLKSLMDNIGNTVREMEQQHLLEKKRARDLDISEKKVLDILWGNYVDHIIAFERLMYFYKTFYRLADKPSREDAFLLAYAAAIARHSSSLRIIKQTINNDFYEKILDDAIPEYGMPSGMYARLKWNTLHVQDMTGVVAGYQYYRSLLSSYKKRGLVDGSETAWAFEAIRRGHDAIANEMKQEGPSYFAANGLDIVKEQGFTVWFPLQRNVSEWMGDTRVKRKKNALISLDQIVVMQKHLNPGDIIIERRNWYLSNIGLPGFWPHAALFIGTYENMRNFFTDSEVNAYYRSKNGAENFLAYLEMEYPDKIRQYREAAHDGYPHQIIEAVSEGVKFSSLQEGALADYIGVLRPRLSKLDIAQAINEAFRFLGRPYDFNFDFLTDSTLVCSELIYKVYKGGPAKQGISFALRDIAGRKAMPANDIVEKFSRDYDRPNRELDFVYFLDGIEKDSKAYSKGQNDLRASHRRMKWDIVQN